MVTCFHDWTSYRLDISTEKVEFGKKFPNPEFDHSVSHNFSAMVNSKLVSSSPL